MVVSAPWIETRSQLERRLTEQTDRCPGDHTRLALGPHVSDGSAGGRERREDVCGEFQTLAPMSARELEAGASGAIVPFCVIAIDDPILRYDVAVGRGTMSCVSVLPELLEIRAVSCNLSLAYPSTAAAEREGWVRRLISSCRKLRRSF